VTVKLNGLCVFGGRGRGRGRWVFGGLCVDMWQLVHQWSFFAVWLFLTVFDDWYTVGTLLNVMSFKMRAERTSCARHITLDWIGLVQSCNVARVSCNVARVSCNITRNTCNITILYQQCTNRQKHSNSKNDHWCTNRHVSTQSPPNTQSQLNAMTLQANYSSRGKARTPTYMLLLSLHGRW